MELLPVVLKSLKIRSLVGGSAQQAFSHPKEMLIKGRRYCTGTLKKEPKLYYKFIFQTW